MSSLWLYCITLLFVTRSSSLNILFVSDGAAGHVTTVYELAKNMKNHNVTFFTQQLAKSYVNFETSATFHLIYSNDSTEAAINEKKLEQELIGVYVNYSFIDSIFYSTPSALPYVIQFLNKTIDILMKQRFDVIVINGLLMWGPILCDAIKTPCVIQSPVSIPNILNLNLPNYFSLLTPTDMTKATSRLFNAIFTFRLAFSSFFKSLPLFYKVFHALPRVPGPFYHSFTLKNLLLLKSKNLHLISMPSTFYVSTTEDPYTKYLGAFIDETEVNLTDDDLTHWLQSKKINSVIFAAFGSTSLIPHDRMLSLIIGIATFLIEVPDSSILLALRNVNYDTYESVLKTVDNDQIRYIFDSVERVKVERGFVPQKWILQQHSVKIFLSHCGMGSIMEAFYYEKTVLCMPFNMDQFSNAVTVVYRGVGLSLFVPNLSPLESLITPYDYRHYAFTSRDVQEKLSKLWLIAIYQQAVKQLSVEMKHAGGVKKAVELIEFFVEMNGTFDHFIPFEATLPFYQRYLLDLFVIFVLLPGMIILFVLVKYCQRQSKQKIE
ncbi:unnamed protein product [Rotaria magnacalcarata]